MAKRQIACILFLVIVPVVARTQTLEHINRCTDLENQNLQLLKDEQAISVMAEYQKGTGHFSSEQLKNQYAARVGELQRRKSISDLGELRKEQWKDIAKNERQIIADCADILDKREQAFNLYGLGDTLISLDQADDAVPILQRCLALDPDFALCWTKLGDAQLALGRNSDAKASFNKAISIGGFDEANAQAIELARKKLFFMEYPAGDPICAPGMPGRGLDQCKDYDKSNQQPSNSTESHSFGTGFFVSNQGHILTNNHVVAGCKSISTGDGKPLQVVNRNAGSDLALLKADVTPNRVATFTSGGSPKPGDAVVAFGFPLPGILSAEGNVSTGVLSATSGIQNDVRFIQISAPVQPGNSGGPLFDSSGHVIGVVVAKLDALQVASTTGDLPQNVNFAVHWSEVRALLDEEGIHYRKEPSLHAMSTRDIAAIGKAVSVTIDCSH